MEATLSSKNQATIPKQAREHLNLKAGDRFKFFSCPMAGLSFSPENPNLKTQRQRSNTGVAGFP